MAFSFCLWRLYLEYKLSFINKSISRTTNMPQERFAIPELVKARKTFVNFHPKIKSNNEDNKMITLRIEE